jgi:hypothetical protein
MSKRDYNNIMNEYPNPQKLINLIKFYIQSVLIHIKKLIIEKNILRHESEGKN